MRERGNAFDKEDSCSTLFALFAVGDVGGCIYLAFLFTIFTAMAELWAGGAILFLQKAFHRDLTQLNPAFQNLKISLLELEQQNKAFYTLKYHFCNWGKCKITGTENNENHFMKLPTSVPSWQVLNGLEAMGYKVCHFHLYH